MPGALDALSVGAALIDDAGVVIACCGRFSELMGRPASKLIGCRGRDLAHPADRANAIASMEQLWRTGESFTMIVRSPTDDEALLEVHNTRLACMTKVFAASLVRRFQLQPWRPTADDRRVDDAADYVVDLSSQLAQLASSFLLPTTADLLSASARTAKREAGLAEAQG